MELAVARRIAAAISASEPRPPLRLPPEAIPFHLPQVRKRLAEVAAYHGVEGDAWRDWIACVEAGGLDDEQAVRELSEQEAYWLASWCFANGQTDLAFKAYERHLASDLHLGQPSAPNPFVNALYLGWALRQGQAERAWTAYAPVRQRYRSRRYAFTSFLCAEVAKTKYVTAKVNRVEHVENGSKHGL